MQATVCGRIHSELLAVQMNRTRLVLPTHTHTPLAFTSHFYRRTHITDISYYSFLFPFLCEQESLGGGGGGEVLDEAAERRAFQEAVMEWRRGPSSVPVAGASSSSSTTASTTTAANVTSRTAAASTTASPGKSSHHQLIPSKEGIDLDDSFASDGGTNSPKKRASGGTGGGDLYTGELNEEAEHAVRIV